MKCFLVIGGIVASCLASAQQAAAQAEVSRGARVGVLSDLESLGTPVSPQDWLAALPAGVPSIDV